jgi:hypothetical protein
MIVVRHGVWSASHVILGARLGFYLNFLGPKAIARITVLLDAKTHCCDA